MFCQSYIILRIQREVGQSVDPDEMVHNEQPHQDLHCLQMQLFVSQMFKVLMVIREMNVYVTFLFPFSVRNSEAPARYTTTSAVLGKFIDYNCIYDEQN